MKNDLDQFTCGVFSVMQELVLVYHEPTLAKEIAKSHGINKAEALKLAKHSGYCVREMNKFIREELAG